MVNAKKYNLEPAEQLSDGSVQRRHFLRKVALGIGTVVMGASIPRISKADLRGPRTMHSGSTDMESRGNSASHGIWIHQRQSLYIDQRLHIDRG